MLVHWDAAEAKEMAASLRSAGWQVRIGCPELRELKEKPPTAVVISLQRLPSHGREVAGAIWYTKWGREIPIVFTDGEAEKVQATREKFPDAKFSTWRGLHGVLAKVAAPTRTPTPKTRRTAVTR